MITIAGRVDLQEIDSSFARGSCIRTDIYKGCITGDMGYIPNQIHGYKLRHGISRSFTVPFSVRMSTWKFHSIITNATQSISLLGLGFDLLLGGEAGRVCFFMLFLSFFV